MRSIGGPSPAVLDPDVLATNLLLTLLVVLLFGLTSALFNSTIDENRGEIEAWRAAIGARVHTLRGRLGAHHARVPFSPPLRSLPKVARVVAILAVTGLVYGFLSPDFGLNAPSVVLFMSLAIGLGIVTYVAEGGSALLSARRYGAASSVRLYATAVLIAIGSVILSRAIDFQPGIVYGFVASNVVLAPLSLSRRQSAALVLVPAASLVAISLGAWLLLAPLAAGAANGDVLTGLLDAVAATVFVAGLEGVFYSLLPITFMDGATVFRWNRVAWGLAFGGTTFLFWHLVLNQYRAYLEAFRQTSVVTALALVLFYGAVTLSVWLSFRLRNRAASTGPSVPSVPAPAAA